MGNQGTFGAGLQFSPSVRPPDRPSARPTVRPSVRPSDAAQSTLCKVLSAKYTAQCTQHEPLYA